MNSLQKSKKVIPGKQQKPQKLSLKTYLPFSLFDFHTLSIADQGLKKNTSFHFLLKQGVRFLSMKECLSSSEIFPRDFLKALQAFYKNTEAVSTKTKAILYFPKNFRSNKSLCLLWRNQKPQALTVFLAAKSQIELLNYAPNNTKQTSQFYLAPGAQLHHLQLSGTQTDTQVTFKSGSLYHSLHYCCSTENSNLDSVGTKNEVAPAHFSEDLLGAPERSTGATTKTPKKAQFQHDLSEHKISLLLQGQKSSARVVYLYSLQKDQKALVKIQQHHTHKNSFSSVHCSSVLRDQAQLDFSGKVAISKQATQTKAFLYNTNLLLSEKAAIHARPQLEIQNPDLECKHGFTSSPIDEETVYYLQSRGLSRQAAENLISRGFLNAKAQMLSLSPKLQDVFDKLFAKSC